MRTQREEAQQQQQQQQQEMEDEAAELASLREQREEAQQQQQTTAAALARLQQQQQQQQQQQREVSEDLARLRKQREEAQQQLHAASAKLTSVREQLMEAAQEAARAASLQQQLREEAADLARLREQREEAQQQQQTATAELTHLHQQLTEAQQLQQVVTTDLARLRDEDAHRAAGLQQQLQQERDELERTARRLQQDSISNALKLQAQHLDVPLENLRAAANRASTAAAELDTINERYVVVPQTPPLSKEDVALMNPAHPHILHAVLDPSLRRGCRMEDIHAAYASKLRDARPEDKPRLAWAFYTLSSIKLTSTYHACIENAYKEVQSEAEGRNHYANSAAAIEFLKVRARACLAGLMGSSPRG